MSLWHGDLAFQTEELDTKHEKTHGGGLRHLFGLRTSWSSEHVAIHVTMMIHRSRYTSATTSSEALSVLKPSETFRILFKECHTHSEIPASTGSNPKGPFRANPSRTERTSSSRKRDLPDSLFWRGYQVTTIGPGDVSHEFVCKSSELVHCARRVGASGGVMTDTGTVQM